MKGKVNLKYWLYSKNYVISYIHEKIMLLLLNNLYIGQDFKEVNIFWEHISACFVNCYVFSGMKYKNQVVSFTLACYV